jgi:oligopeptide/dipeptide ABC transporter ATP-binding protein
MYLGKVVELADCESLYASPQHPYTRALLSAVPQADPLGGRQRIVLSGEPPKATAPPGGCQFHPRCFMAEPRCAREQPTLKATREKGERQQVSCLLVE